MAAICERQTCRHFHAYSLFSCGFAIRPPDKTGSEEMIRENARKSVISFHFERKNTRFLSFLEYFS